jgi:hypothetical protein
MAENMTTALKNAIFDYFLRPGADVPVRPTEHYLALYTTPTNVAGNGTEVAGVNYERREVELGVPFAVGNKLRVANTNEINFPVAGGPWGQVSHVAVLSALTGGTMLLQGSLQIPVTVGFNEMYRVAVGELVFDLT